MERIFICPNNDLEAKTIIELLERNGEDYIVTGQGWGASWEMLEPEVVEKLEEARKLGKEVYGVELQGNSNGAINIDHHVYGEDDRSNQKSSIEQVADVLGVELSIDEQFVAANDKGFIPEMEKLGAELGIREEDLKEIIANIRMRDRQVQGITMEQEVQAQEAVGKLGDLTEKRDYICMDLPHSKTATVTDRLYGKYDNLLISSADGETNFYGKTEIIKMLNEKFPGGWFGGQVDQGSGFWGGYADQEAIKQAVQEMIDKIKLERESKEDLKQYWFKKYGEDKIGTIAKLSQAMQHESWLREWQRIHEDEPRIKPITQKVNGEKVKVGEADIAVPWSALHQFFKQGNEYGDVETVKFLTERIESGDISKLTQKELHELSERENVKWSDEKHSLNPFQGYLYSFADENTGVFATREASESYGNFTPMSVYRYDNNGPTDCSWSQSIIDDAYSRVFATKLIKRFMEQGHDNGKFELFKNFDITSVTTPEQIAELDKRITTIVHSSEFEYFIEELEGNAEYEKELEDEIKTEVEIEIKKDSDRIENAHKVYVALETGNLDELLKDPETAKWAEEIYEREMKNKGQQGIGEE